MNMPRFTHAERLEARALQATWIDPRHAAGFVRQLEQSVAACAGYGHLCGRRSSAASPPAACGVIGARPWMPCLARAARFEISAPFHPGPSA
jgi:hypothetical protein